jgi:hypothetical protein
MEYLVKEKNARRNKIIDEKLMPIRDRIVKAILELPENRDTKNKYPKAPGVHNTAIKRLIAKESMPNTKTMLDICNATGLSPDYFFFGEKAAATRLESPRESYDHLSPAPMDTERLAAIVTKTLQYLNAHPLKISEKRIGNLTAKLYEHEIIEKEPITPEIIKVYLRLT